MRGEETGDESNRNFLIKVIWSEAAAAAAIYHCQMFVRSLPSWRHPFLALGRGRPRSLGQDSGGNGGGRTEATVAALKTPPQEAMA